MSEIDKARGALGFRTVAEILELAGSQSILDPYSVLIGSTVVLGSNNTFFPGAVLQADSDSTISIGSGNIFHGGAVIQAFGGGQVIVRDDVSFGPGGVRVVADGETARIVIEDRVRLASGAEIAGSSFLGTGAQILGAVQAQSVHLEGGEDFRSPEVARRGAVLKGNGRARNIQLRQGEVINGFVDLAHIAPEPQTNYHPTSK